MATPKAQDLCTELYTAVEMSLGDAWVSDDAGTDDPREYMRFARGHLTALEEARNKMQAFIRKYRHI